MSPRERGLSLDDIFQLGVSTVLIFEEGLGRIDESLGLRTDLVLWKKKINPNSGELLKVRFGRRKLGEQSEENEESGTTTSQEER